MRCTNTNSSAAEALADDADSEAATTVDPVDRRDAAGRDSGPDSATSTWAVPLISGCGVRGSALSIQRNLRVSQTQYIHSKVFTREPGTHTDATDTPHGTPTALHTHRERRRGALGPHADALTRSRSSKCFTAGFSSGKSTGDFFLCFEVINGGLGDAGEDGRSIHSVYRGR